MKNLFYFIAPLLFATGLITGGSAFAFSKSHSTPPPPAAPPATPAPPAAPAAPRNYQIGVQYQFSMNAKEWGRGDWLYGPLQSVGTDAGGFTGKPNQRVPRLYPERQPLVNGQGKWLDIWDTSAKGDVSAEIDMMKGAGIDYILYLTEWARNTDPSLPNGFYGFGAEIDAFIEVNKHRKPDQQVKFCLELASNHLEVGYKGRDDFIAVFREKIKFAIEKFKTKDDAGNPLYYFREGKPVLSWWEGAAFLREAAANQTTGSELIAISQQMAKDAGYPGIYWVDSSNTIVDRSLNNAHDQNYVAGDFAIYQDLIADTGFDAETGFIYHGVSGIYGYWMNYEGYGQAIQAYSAIWKSMIDGAKNTVKKHPNFKYFPLVSPGWDSRAIGEADQPCKHDQSRSCDGAFDNHNSDPLAWGCSPDGGLFMTMLQNAQAVIDQNQDLTGQMLVIGTWNDLLEGHYLIPTVGDHGAHAAAVKAVFKPQAATSPTPAAPAATPVVSPTAAATLGEKPPSTVTKLVSDAMDSVQQSTKKIIDTVSSWLTPEPAATDAPLNAATTAPAVAQSAPAVASAAVNSVPANPPASSLPTVKSAAPVSNTKAASDSAAISSTAPPASSQATSGAAASEVKQCQDQIKAALNPTECVDFDSTPAGSDDNTDCSKVSFQSLSPDIQKQLVEALKPASAPLPGQMVRDFYLAAALAVSDRHLAQCDPDISVEWDKSAKPAAAAKAPREAVAPPVSKKPASHINVPIKAEIAQ